MLKGLYFITPQGTDAQVIDATREALKGGAQAIQFRDKERATEARIELARQLVQLCQEAGATFLVNDFPDVAEASFADGVHLGQDDASVADVRRQLGPDKLIGISTRTVDQALKAEMQGADYIGIGSMFPTKTKDDAELVGVDTLRKARKAVKIPIVAIGGITPGNAAEVIEAGADALAVVSAITEDRNPAMAAREFSLLFNSRRDKAGTRVMTIAGSDPGGGAGIQADLKSISLLGSYGTSAITILTAQNTQGVKGVLPVSVDFIGRQVEMVLDDIGTDTVKTGMLYSVEIVEKVTEILSQRDLVAVIDPVMIAKGGAALLKQDAAAVLRQKLLPKTFLLTPNIPEAEALTGLTITTLEEMETAAQSLQEMGARHVLLKGGHKDGDATDVLRAGATTHQLPGERFDTTSTHGTGCSYAAATATLLAQGQPVVDAVTNAKHFISEAIRQAVPIGQGHGPINHYAGAQALRDAGQETKDE